MSDLRLADGAQVWVGMMTPAGLVCEIGRGGQIGVVADCGIQWFDAADLRADLGHRPTCIELAIRTIEHGGGWGRELRVDGDRFAVTYCGEDEHAFTFTDPAPLLALWLEVDR